MENRLKYNEMIIGYILDYIRAYPDMRFGQALYNLGIATHSIELNREDIPKIQEFLEDTINSRQDAVENHAPRYRDIFFEESEDTYEKLYSSKDNGE